MPLKENMPSIGGYIDTSRHAKNFSDILQQGRVNAQNKVNAENNRIFGNRQLDLKEAQAADLNAQRQVENEQNALKIRNQQAQLAWARGAPRRAAAAERSKRERIRQENIELYKTINSAPERNKIFRQQDVAKLTGEQGQQFPLTEEQQQFAAGVENNNLNYDRNVHAQQVTRRLQNLGYGQDRINGVVGSILSQGINPGAQKAQLDSSTRLAKEQFSLLGGGGSSNGSSGNTTGAGGRGEREAIADYNFVQNELKRIGADDEASTLDVIADALSLGFNNKDVTGANIQQLLGSAKVNGVKAPALFAAMKSTGFMNDGEYKGLDPDELFEPQNKAALDSLLSVGRQIQAAHEKSTVSRDGLLRDTNKIFQDEQVRNNRIFGASAPQNELQNLYNNFTSNNQQQQNTVEQPIENSSVFINTSEPTTGNPVTVPADNSTSTDTGSVVSNSGNAQKVQQDLYRRAKKAVFDSLPPPNELSSATGKEQERLVQEAQREVKQLTSGTRIFKTAEQRERLNSLLKLLDDYEKRKRILSNR